MLQGYLVARANILNVSSYQTAWQFVLESLPAHEGRCIVFTREITVLNGADDGFLLGILEFPTLRQAQAFVDSALFDELKPSLLESGLQDLWVMQGARWVL